MYANIRYSSDQMRKSNMLCPRNKFEDDVPIDPITFDRIPFQHIELASDGIGYNKGTLFEYMKSSMRKDIEGRLLSPTRDEPLEPFVFGNDIKGFREMLPSVTAIHLANEAVFGRKYGANLLIAHDIDHGNRDDPEVARASRLRDLEIKLKSNDANMTHQDITTSLQFNNIALTERVIHQVQYVPDIYKHAILSPVAVHWKRRFGDDVVNHLITCISSNTYVGV